jgi:3-phosphoshikimate 1-carboxyvinyltransferase
MLGALGVQIVRDRDCTLLYPTRPEGWSAFAIDIPGDLSSAAFHVAFAAATPGSDLRVEGVGLNPGRARYLELLAAHGAALRTTRDGEGLGEPCGSIRVAGGRLQPLRLAGTDTVRCIDEIPALAAAWVAAGSSLRVRDAAELRVKESDRIAKLVELITTFGGVARAQAHGFDTEAVQRARPGRFDAAGDHRLAMAAAMLALRTPGESVVAGTECVRTSYPEFVADLVRNLRPVRKGPIHPRPAVRKRT